MYKILLYGLVMTLFVSCQYENEETIFPENNCDADTKSMSYSTDIQPILSKYNCISCHSNQSPSGNIILETYEQVQEIGTNGKLNGVITHADSFTAMPLSQDKMTDCDIAKVQKWISEGMPNN